MIYTKNQKINTFRRRFRKLFCSCGTGTLLPVRAMGLLILATTTTMWSLDKLRLLYPDMSELCQIKHTAESPTPFRIQNFSQIHT